MTVTSALHLGYGGAPAGPAGTGREDPLVQIAPKKKLFALMKSQNLHYHRRALQGKGRSRRCTHKPVHILCDTGKTETVKDLAKALGVPCLVFNCSKELDHHVMSRLFRGLAQTGAWACFDEFNRIDIEVLSVVAQLLSKIQASIRAQRDTMEFDGRSTHVDHRQAKGKADGLLFPRSFTKWLQMNARELFHCVCGTFQGRNLHYQQSRLRW